MSKYVFRMFFFIVRLAVLVGIVFGLFQLGEYAYDFGYQIYSDHGVEAYPGTDMAVTIAEGETVTSVAQRFERLGLIKDARVFYIQERLSKYHGEMIPGNYVLNTSQSGNAMIDIITGHREEKETEET